MNAFGRLSRAETRIDFAGRWRRWFAISGLVILIGLISLGVRGLNFSIDFKGGTIWQVPTTATVTQARNAVAKINSGVASQAEITVQINTNNHKRTIQVQAGTKTTSDQTLITNIKESLATMAHTNANNVAVNSVGAAWGSQITNKAIKAVIIFLVVVGLYIWLRFEGKMAIAALVALLHDILVTVGIYSLSGFQVSPDTVIAFLTILGYSLYDTIVVFDKVEENTKGLASSNRQTYTDMVNLSMNQVLARSINTSFVAIIPILSILVIGAGVLGATTLADFGLALFIGLTTGAYSSIFIASPLLGLLKEREPRYREIRRRIANLPGAGKAAPALAGAVAGGGGGSSTGPRRRPPTVRRPSQPAPETVPEQEAPSAPTAVFNVRADAGTQDPPSSNAPASSPARGRAGAAGGSASNPARGRSGAAGGGRSATDGPDGAGSTPPSDGDNGDARGVTPTPPRTVNRPPPRPRKKTRRR
jgi:preprotein translocase subunit SecF